MIYSCSELPVEFWIKLQQVQTETYPSLQRIKRNLAEQSHPQQTLHSPNPASSTYISPIFSLEKPQKHAYNSHLAQQKRLLYHNYNKYKTIPFSYNHLYLPKEYSSTLVSDLTCSLYSTVVEKRLNFCFLAFGSKDAEMQPLIEGKQGSTEGVYYSVLVKLSQMIKNFNQSTKFPDSTSLTYTINFLAITQTTIIDLLNISNQVYVSQDPKTAFSQPLDFQNATECSFTSSYELYTTFKRVIFRRKELASWSVFVVKVNFYSAKMQTTKKLMNQALLVEWVKDQQSFMSLEGQRTHHRNKSSFGQKSLLCLNQCILEVFKNMQIRNKRKMSKEKISQQADGKMLYSHEEVSQVSSLPNFRNSLITRILKPFLLFNTQFCIMAVCSINQEHQNDSYQSLMLGKHLSNLHSLLIEEQLPPISSKRMMHDSESQSQDEQVIDQDDANYVPQNFETIQSPKDTKYSKGHINSKSYHLTASNSPKKLKKSIKQSNSRQQISIEPNAKQQKVRQKLMDILEESKKKKQQQNGQKAQISQISKKVFEGKSKCLKAKKQLNMLKAKANTKQLKAKIIDKVDEDTEMIEQEIKRLNFDQRKLQKELEELKSTVEAKIVSIRTQTKEQPTSSDRKKAKLQKIKLLKSHLKNELQITEMQIDEFLQQKQSIKSIYLHEINILGHHEKQLIKKIEMNKNNSLVKNLPSSKDHKSLPKVRLSKEMQPFYNNSLGSRVRASLTLDPEQRSLGYSPDKQQVKRYATQTIQKGQKLPKSLSKGNHIAQNSLDSFQVQKIKQQRLLIRKKQHLLDKINKGKGQYAKFLEDTAQKYLNYNTNNSKRKHSIQ